MNEASLFDSFAEFGIVGIILFSLIFCGWRYVQQVRADGRKDYEGVTKRLNQMEDFQKDRLTEVVEKNTVVVTQNNEVLKEVKNVMQNCKGNN